MIKSMTGYGLAQGEYQHKKITIEIRSLNSKFLELSVKLPKDYYDRENLLRMECSKIIERGKANVSINIEQLSEAYAARKINQVLFQQYYDQLQEMARKLGEPNGSIFQEVLKLPEVWNSDEGKIDEEEWSALYNLFIQALQNFNSFRSEEGATLMKDVEQRVQNILQAIPEIEKYEVNRIPMIKEKLENLLSKEVGQDLVDRNRLEQELIYYIEKFDITEEKIRLKSHCDYFLNVMQEKDSNGKKLGFISQEIGREVNTLGSKANDVQIQQIVIGMKDDLEKIKEQLLNIL